MLSYLYYLLFCYLRKSKGRNSNKCLCHGHIHLRHYVEKKSVKRRLQ